MSPSSIMICPATCELCGQWMPGHSKDCPRSGVHPSQWSLNNISIDSPIMIDETDIAETFMQDTINNAFGFHHGLPTRNSMMILMTDDNI